MSPELLKCMSPEHAINALRHELSGDLAWLPDWIESLRPSDAEMAVIQAADQHGMDAEDIELLGKARVGTAAHSAALLTVLWEYEAEVAVPSDLEEIMKMAARLGKAAITNVDDLEDLLSGDES